MSILQKPLAPNEWLPMGDNHTERMMVFGGWIIRDYRMNNRTHHQHQDRGDAMMGTDMQEEVNMCFVPDPYHEWDSWTEKKHREMQMRDVIKPRT